MLSKTEGKKMVINQSLFILNFATLEESLGDLKVLFLAAKHNLKMVLIKDKDTISLSLSLSLSFSTSSLLLKVYSRKC